MPSKLQLSVAVGNYDRVRPLMDGVVQIDGVDPIFMSLPPEEIFFRAFRGIDFDICELSLSSFTIKTAGGNCPYVGVPAFVSRAFRHNSIYVRQDRVKSPEDMKGKRVGLPEYQLTACVWARIILQDDARPYAGGELIFRQSDALALHVFRRFHAVLAHIDGVVAERARDEGRYTDIGTIPAGSLDREARQRQLANVEIDTAKCAKEDLLGRQAHEDRVDAVDLHDPVHQRANPVVISDGYGELKLRWHDHNPSGYCAIDCICRLSRHAQCGKA